MLLGLFSSGPWTEQGQVLEQAGFLRQAPELLHCLA